MYYVLLLTSPCEEYIITIFRLMAHFVYETKLYLLKGCYSYLCYLPKVVAKKKLSTLFQITFEQHYCTVYMQCV